MSSLGSNTFGALQTRKAGHKMRDARYDYIYSMDDVIDNFMQPWYGTAPEGYDDWTQYESGGERKFNKDWREVKVDGKSVRNHVLSAMRNQGFNKWTKEEQETFIGEKLGRPFELKDRIKSDQGPYYEVVSPGTEFDMSTFEGLQAAREAGYQPSMEQQYRPWIKPGEDAYQIMTDAIVNGNFEKFYTSPNYEFIKKEGEKAITNLANAGRIPTSDAQKALVAYGQNLASGEYTNWLANLGGVAAGGYDALTDLKTIESAYKSGEASMEASKLGNSYNMEALEAQMMIEGGKMGGAAIGSAAQMIAGGVSGGMGGGGGGGESSAGMQTGGTTGFMDSSQGGGFTNYLSSALKGVSSYNNFLRN